MNTRIKLIALFFLFIINSFAQTNDELKTKVDSLNQLAFTSRGTNPLETIRYAEQALIIADSIDYAVGKCQSYSFVGVGYRNISYYKEALDNYLKGLAIADSIKNFEQLAFAYNNVGNLYLRSGNDSLAQVYLQKTLDLAIAQNSGVLKGYAYKNLGSFHFTKNNFSTALELFEKSLDEREKIEDFWGIANTLNEMGALYNSQKNYASALASHDIAFETAKKIKNNQIIIGEVYLGKAQVYFDMMDYENAKVTIEKSRKIFEALNARSELATIYKLISNINYATNKYKEAFDYLKRFQNLNDSIKVLNAERQIEIMEILFVSDKNKKENELLKKENAIKLLQFEQEKQFTNLLILVSFFLLVVAVISYWFYKGKQKANIQLIKKNELIESQKNELIRINETKDRLFSIIAHDLKNPFGSLMNLTSLLLDEIQDLSLKELQEMVGAINNASKSGYRLLENLLLWAQSQKGHIHYEPENIDFAKIVEDNFSLYSEAAKEKNVKLILNKITDDNFIYADKNMIDAVIRNLVNNAIKYSRMNSTIKITTQMNSDKLNVCVEDEGIGMTQKVIDKLFSISGKEIQVGTNGEKGTGLGLVVCKEFVDINKGDISIKSEINKGTKICLTLPIKK